MELALHLLENQPTDWPKWQLGRNASGWPTADLHLFIFEPTEFGLGLGRAVAACQFVDGAQWVSRWRSTYEAPEITPRCEHCVEVALQHLLNTSES